MPKVDHDSRWVYLIGERQQQPFSQLLGLTLLTLRLASWSESAFFLSVCRGSGGSHWSRYGMSNQHSSCRQQSACLLVVTSPLCLMLFFILHHQLPDSYYLVYFILWKLIHVFSPSVAGSVSCVGLSSPFYFPNVPALSHSLTSGDQYHTTMIEDFKWSLLVAPFLYLLKPPLL